MLMLKPTDFAAYFAFMFVLGFMGPNATSAEVFNNFGNAAGWPNVGVAVLVGTMLSRRPIPPNARLTDLQY